MDTRTWNFSPVMSDFLTNVLRVDARAVASATPKAGLIRKSEVFRRSIVLHAGRRGGATVPASIL